MSLGDGNTIHFENNILAAKLAQAGRSIGFDILHHNAVVQIEEVIPRDRALTDAYDADAQPCPADIALGDELLTDILGDIDRHCEGESRVSATIDVDHGIDADNLAVDVAKRPAAVARIDRGICLDELLIVSIFSNKIGPAFGADDANGERVRRGLGSTDRKGKIADLRLIAVSEFSYG